MDVPAPTDQSILESPSKWSDAGLRWSIEFGKDLLTVQAQQRQGFDQRASQLIPVSGTLLVALAGAVFGGHFQPVGGAVFFLWLMVLFLLAGMAMCFGILVRPPGNYAGMEPKDVMHAYGREGTERGVLGAVSDEYQRRITSNREQLTWMSRASLAATTFVLAGVMYGALMIHQNRQERSLAATGTTTQEQARPPVTSP